MMRLGRMLLTLARKAPVLGMGTKGAEVLGGQRRSALAFAFTGVALYGCSKTLSQELQSFEVEDDLAEGQMKQLQVGPDIEDTILLIKYKGKVFATQSKCSHFGFSLAKGTLVGDKLICPLHNAGFSIETGKADQGPVFDGLQTFPVEVKSGKILVKVPKQGWDAKPAPQVIGEQNVSKDQKVVIVGAGPAALSAAESLRAAGYRGMIFMVTKEKAAAGGPYDRTSLSKVMDPSKAPKPIRSEENLRANGITLLSETEVVSLDFKHKQVALANGQSLPYDKLLIASGCVNRVPPIKGLTHTPYFTLRDINDYEAINEQIRKPGARNVTIIGAGFIGLEVASAIKLALKDQVNVTIIDQQKEPLAHVLGEEVGHVLKELQEKNGVRVITRAKVREVQGSAEKPQAVLLEKEEVPCDVLIMATGVRCALDFAEELVDPESQGIATNVFLETKQKDVFAAGDVASYPYWYTGEKNRIEHFNEAIYQGAIAGLNMAGRKQPVDNIPFFWTRQFNNSLCFTGVNKDWDELIVKGDLSKHEFLVYYVRSSDDKVLAAASMGLMNKLQIINEAMRNGVMPPASEVKAPAFKLEDLLPKIAAKNPKCTRCNLSK